MKKHEHGCDFCTDLRNIEPAKYIGGGNDKFKEWIKKAREQKKFILDLGDKFAIVDECPMCGYEFTADDYDSYEN